MDKKSIINYKDVLLKTSYYKEIVIRELAKYGAKINDDNINERLNNIDKYLAIFSKKTRFPHEMFDANLFTKEMSEIHQDLKFLYELLYDLSVVEFEDIRAYVDAHLKEIDRKAKEYRARIDIETNSSFIGETIFYVDGPFPWFTKDNYLYTDLGIAAIRPGSKIALLVSGHNLSNKNIMVGLKTAEEIDYIQPYNHGHDTFTTEGGSEVITYESNLNKDIVLDNTFDLTPEKIKLSDDNSYLAYAGKNKVLINQDRDRQHIGRDDDYSFYIEGNWEVSFYIKNGTYAKFEFSRTISNKNFDGVEIESIKRVHKVLIKDSGSFGFSVTTDGTIYAEQKRVYVVDNKLMHYGGSLSNDFLIEEYKSKDPIKYELFLRIFSDSEEYPAVDSVAIKELIESDVIINDIL